MSEVLVVAPLARNPRMRHHGRVLESRDGDTACKAPAAKTNANPTRGRLRTNPSYIWSSAVLGGYGPGECQATPKYQATRKVAGLAPNHVPRIDGQPTMVASG